MLLHVAAPRSGHYTCRFLREGSGSGGIGDTQRRLDLSKMRRDGDTGGRPYEARTRLCTERAPCRSLD